MMSKMLCTLMFPLLAAMIRSSSARASGVIRPVIVRPGTRTDAPPVVSPREEASRGRTEGREKENRETRQKEEDR